MGLVNHAACAYNGPRRKRHRQPHHQRITLTAKALRHCIGLPLTPARPPRQLAMHTASNAAPLPHAALPSLLLNDHSVQQPGSLQRGILVTDGG